MSNTLNAKTYNGSDPAFQAETDALLETITEQITLHTFDPNNHTLLQRMVEGFADTRGMVRLSIAETLGDIGEPVTPFLLEAVSRHSNPVVRRAAAKTLTLIADPIAVPTLIHALLNDEDTVVKGSAVGALARTGEAAVPPLLEILSSPDHPESAKGHAAWALAFIGADAKEHLYRAIGSSSPEVRCAVVGAIAKAAQEAPEDSAFQLLIEALNDSESIVRCEAAAALGNLAYRPAIPNVVELLHHSDWESRKAAALALMKIGVGGASPSENQIALNALQTALTQESEVAVQPVIKLAISQIERQFEADDWDE